MSELEAKGQVTLFILIALVVVIIIAVAAYIFQKASTETTKTESKKSQSIPLEAQTIYNYVSACLDKTLMDGLATIGAQGGRIYSDQGETASIPMEFGSTYMNMTNLNNPGEPQARLWYGITSLDLVGNLQCATSLVTCSPPSGIISPVNAYPSNDPISTAQCDARILTIGCLGRTNRLNSMGNLGFDRQLEKYISTNMVPCLDFSSFESQGYDITSEGTPLVTVTLTDTEVTAAMYYELAIVDPQTQKQSFITEFFAERPTQLKSLYRYAQQIALQDITSAGYDISAAADPSNSIAVAVLRSSSSIAINPAEDSIIQITDTTTGSKFQFARKNRAPVIEPLGAVAVTAPDKAGLDAAIMPKIHDPDESVPVVKYLASISSPNELASFSCGMSLVVCASDNAAYPCHPTADTSKDWETITITC